MQVQFKVSGRDLAPSLRSLVEQHFRFAVYPYKSAVSTVEIQVDEAMLGDWNAGTRCRAVLNLRNGRTLTIERRDARVESAVQRVAKRIFHSLRCSRAKRSAELAPCTS
ncbi:MAG: hypothetical protein KJ000_13185 [Pirellulaceae bacterium]|nr:hypothetical protein [Pirellulaceae bacterium]